MGEQFNETKATYPKHQRVFDFVEAKRLPKDSQLTPFEYIVRVWKGDEKVIKKPSNSDYEKYAKQYWENAILDRNNLEIQNEWVDFKKNKRSLAAEFDDSVEKYTAVNDKLKKMLDDEPEALKLLREEKEDDDDEEVAGLGDTLNSLSTNPFAQAAFLVAFPEVKLAEEFTKETNNPMANAMKQRLLESAKNGGVLSGSGTFPPMNNQRNHTSSSFDRWPNNVKQYALFIFNINNNRRKQIEFGQRWDTGSDATKEKTLIKLRNSIAAARQLRYFEGDSNNGESVLHWIDQAINSLSV